jgi:2-C-methyl-D-erythritol 4-phosphate cytidylyltransferase
VTTKALIIPAAGVGRRMKKEIPKPYLQLGRCSILEHTISRFLQLDGLQDVIIAASEPYLDNTRNILEKVLPEGIRGRTVAGGQTRQDSIYNGLQEISDVDLVLVHDAVRPFVKAHHIAECCSQAVRYGAAILGVPAKDTIKRIDDEQVVEETPPRKYLWQTQTPQVFQRSVLFEAYESAREENYIGTDDSSLAERLGTKVKMVLGDRSNFKITYPLDLLIAELIIKEENKL